MWNLVITDVSGQRPVVLFGASTEICQDVIWAYLTTRGCEFAQYDGDYYNAPRISLWPVA